MAVESEESLRKMETSQHPEGRGQQTSVNLKSADLHSKFQGSQGYTVRLCLKTPNQNNNNKLQKKKGEPKLLHTPSQAWRAAELTT